MAETAVILAAGRGTKLWPYGDTWAKAALPIANWPLIQWQIETMQACGVQRFLVVTGHHDGQVRDAVSGFDNVECIDQLKPNGTADALLHALDYIDDETFLVVYGDVLFAEEDLRALMDRAGDGEPPAAMVQALNGKPSGEWLCANLEDDFIKTILGHPREATHRLCGVYALTRDVVPFVENNPGLMTSVEVGAMPPMEMDLAESISRFIQRGGEMFAVETREAFFDIDKPWHLLDANFGYLGYLGARLTQNEIAASAVIEDGAEIDGFVVMGENSFIGRDVKIKGNLWLGDHSRIVDGAIVGANCSIGENTIVREYCRIEDHSSIGHRCVVGHAAEFSGILMDGAYSFHYGEYWGVIGRSTDLGAATVCGNLRFDDQLTAHRVKGRREVPVSASVNAAFLGDFVRTGVNAIIMPGVRVGAYSVVGAGVLLSEDLPNNTLVHAEQTLIKKPWGPERYGW
ncbi:MAG: NTP transferase domain-containing protein [bacterium]|nr:NTP transferase domain-containing protein [bacterium]